MNRGENLNADNYNLDATRTALVLGESDSFPQAVLDSFAAQVAVLDRSGNVVLVNKAWKRFVSESRCICNAGVKVGMNYLDVCRKGGAAAAEILAGVESVLNGAQISFSRDFPCHARNGPRWFLLLVTGLSGRKPGVVISRIDITAQKQGEAARAQFAAIVESSSSAIMATNLDGIVVSWNPGAEQLYGYSAKEMIGRSIRSVIPPDHYHEFDSALTTLRSGESVETFETVRRRKDRRLIPVDVTVSQIRNTKGTIVGMSGIVRDVSERRRLEAEVLHASEREQLRIAQDLHDGLTQHVAGIACIAKVLRDDLSKENSPHAAIATKIATLLEDASAQTRNLARGLYPVPSEATGLMTALRALTERTTELYHIVCTFNCQRPVLIRDTHIANHLYRIAQEAVTNAVRHGKPKRIEIALSSTGARLVLGVRDDGTGIRRKPNANGIGLRAMHYRANLISGTLVVQHTPGRGTEILCTVDRHNHVTANKTASA